MNNAQTQLTLFHTNKELLENIWKDYGLRISTTITNKELLENIWRDYGLKISPTILGKDEPIIIDQAPESSGILITESLLHHILNNFKEEVLLKLKDGQYVNVLLKLKMQPEGEDRPQFKSITKMQRINYESAPSLIPIFYESWLVKSGGWGLQSGDCRTFRILEVIFSYKIAPLDKITPFQNQDKSKLAALTTKDKEKIYKNIKFSGYNIPSTMDISKWGDNYITIGDKIIIGKNGQSGRFFVTKFNDYNIIEYKVNDTIILYFKDEQLDGNNLETFRRTVDGKKIFDYKDGEVIFKRKINKTFKIKKLQPDNNLNLQYLTMDIETMSIKGELIPYCVCIYYEDTIKNTRSEQHAFYLTDYKDSEELIKTAIRYIMKRKFNGYKVYIHNFSNFDGIFLLKQLTDLGNKIDTIINDGDFKNITLNFDKRYKLSFRDSYLMLNASLKGLAKSFKVKDKGLFPIYFVNDKYNSNIDLNYIGPIPDYKYFSGITEEDFNTKFKNKSETYWKINKFNGITPEIYKNYCNLYGDKLWNLREETIKYCMNDCEVLSKIMLTFSKHIFELFRVNVIKYTTLPSLSFALFRTHFMEEENIPIISGALYDFIKEGYYGGAVDVYRPKGTTIRRYDVNSLYPSVMEPNDMPVGDPITFEGEITTIIPLDDLLGFFKVEVTTPDYLEAPVLLKREKNKTIAPLGSWIGVYSTVEIIEYQKIGYKFKILSGVYFEKSKIFKEFVNFWYDLKSKSDKNDPLYIIAKLFLNALYGRFGMDPSLSKHKIVDKDGFYKLEDKYEILEIIDLKNGLELVKYSDKENLSYESDNYQCKTNVSVSIAAMVTAYSRVFMSKFKNNPNFNLYYSDTDSIDIDQDLDPKYISNNQLGKMKLECIFEEVVYLAPKVYGGIIKSSTGTEDLVKVKGLKNPISYLELKSLLKKSSVHEAYHEKWFKNISDAKIYVKDQIYSISITDNKRRLIFNNDNILVKTEPIIIKEI